ncbi:unnamed protein product [Rotaria socialis]
MLHTITIDHVKEALDQFNRGQKYLYNTITATIKENQTNEHWLIQLLNELRDNVDLFENMNDQFLDFLQLQINWAKQTKVVLDTFGTFQITLISSNTKHAQRYLGFLFTLFAIPENSTNPPLIHDFAHETLQQLVLIVPLNVQDHICFHPNDGDQIVFAHLYSPYIRNIITRPIFV